MEGHDDARGMHRLNPGDRQRLPATWSYGNSQLVSVSELLTPGVQVSKLEPPSIALVVPAPLPPVNVSSLPSPLSVLVMVLLPLSSPMPSTTSAPEPPSV